MAPDADAASSVKRADPFAPLTSETLDVGDGHELYVESVGRAGGIPAVYLHGGPGSGCQPDHRRLFDPDRFHAVLFDQRGCGRSRPKGSREHNTTPHLIADMEKIREKFGFERWMVVGGSWGATLALAYAQAHPERVSGIALRATFLGTRAEVETPSPRACRNSIPRSTRIFSSVLPAEERARPVEAYCRRILDPDPAVHGPASRAWHDTERALSEHKAAKTRIDLASLNVWRTLPATPFMEAHYFVHDSFMTREPVVAERRQARRHSRHHRPGPLRSAVPSRHRSAREAWPGPKFASWKKPAIRSMIRRARRGHEVDRGSRVEDCARSISSS